MRANDRVILIKGDATKWYDQAIFIVNKNMPQDKIPVDFVAEAEKIIQSYLQKQSGQAVINAYTKKAAPAVSAAVINPPKILRSNKDKRFDRILNFIMICGCIVIAGIFLFEILGSL